MNDMTIILDQQPPSTNFMVVKRYLSKGDRIIFQWDSGTAQQHDGPDLDRPTKELEVVVTDIIQEPGLMKGYCVAGWSPAAVGASKQS